MQMQNLCVSRRGLTTPPLAIMTTGHNNGKRIWKKVAFGADMGCN